MSFFKNIIKSTPYTMDIAVNKSKVGSIKEDITRQISSVKSIYKDIKDELSSDEMKEEMKMYSDLWNDFKSNLKSSIKTGKIHSTKREDAQTGKSSMFGGMSLDMNDFGDMSNDWDMGDSDDVWASDGSPSVDASSSGGPGISVVPGVSAISKSSKIQARTMALVAGSVNTGNEILSRMMDFKESTEAEFYKKSTEFYTNFSSNFEILMKSQMEYTGIAKDVMSKYHKKYLEEKETTRKDELFSGDNLDLKVYSQIILKNIDEMSMGIVSTLKDRDMRKMAAEMFRDAVANPLSHFIGHFGAKFLDNALGSGFDMFKETMSFAGKNFIGTMNKLAATAPDDSLLGIIGRALGNKASNKTFNPGDYEKGKVEFDGITKKSITFVIPTLLSKILTVNTALYEAYAAKNDIPRADLGKYEVMDFKDGKFTNTREIQKKIESEKRGNASELSSYSKDFAKKLNIEGVDPEELERGIESALRHIALSGNQFTAKSYSKSDSHQNKQGGMNNIQRFAQDHPGLQDFEAKMMLYMSQTMDFNDLNKFNRSLRNFKETRNEYEEGKRENADLYSSVEGLADFKQVKKKSSGIVSASGESISSVEKEPESKFPLKYGSDLMDKIQMPSGERYKSTKFDPSKNMDNFFEHASDWINSLFYGDDFTGSQFTGTGIKDLLFGRAISSNDTVMDRLKNRANDWFIEPFSNYFKDNVLPSIDSILFDPEKGFLTGIKTHFGNLQQWLYGAVDPTGELAKEGLFKSVQNSLGNYFTEFKSFLFGPEADVDKSSIQLFADAAKTNVIEPLKKHMSEMFKSLFGDDFTNTMNKAKKWAGDNEFMLKSGGAGFLAGLILPGGPVVGGLLGLAYSTESVQNFLFGKDTKDGGKVDFTISPEQKEKMKGMGARAGIGVLAGLVLPGGPVIGGLLGLAYSTESVQNFLFGKKDKDGNLLEAGLLGNDEKTTLRKYGIGAAGGVLASLILPGGPLIGGVLGILHSTETVQNYLYGESGLLEKFKNKLTDFRISSTEILWGKEGLKDSDDPTLSQYDKIGIFGVLGNKFEDYSEKLGTYLFGDGISKAEGGKEGLLTGLQNLVIDDIWKPLRTEISTSMASIRSFISTDLIKPLKEAYEPIVVELKYQFHKFIDFGKEFSKNVLSGAADIVGEVFGIQVADTLRNSVLNPLKEVLGFLKLSISRVLGGILKFPVSIIKGIADKLRERHAANKDKFGKYYSSNKSVNASASATESEGLSAEEVEAQKNAKFTDSVNKIKSGAFKLISSGKTTRIDGTVVSKSKTSAVVPAETKAAAEETVEVIKKTNEISQESLNVSKEQKGFVNQIREKMDAMITWWKNESPLTEGMRSQAENTSEMKSKMFEGTEIGSQSRDYLAQIADNTNNIYAYVSKISYKMGASDEMVGGAINPSGFSISDMLNYQIMGKGTFTKITKGFRWMFTKLKGGASSIMDGIGAVVSAPFKFMGKIAEEISKNSSKLFDALAGVVTNIGEMFEGASDFIFDTMDDLRKVAVKSFSFLLGIGDKISYVFTRAMDGVMDVVTGFARNIGKLMEPMTTAVSEIFKAVGQTFKFTTSLLGSFGIPLVEAAGAATGIIGKGIGKMFKGAFDKVSGIRNMFKEKKPVDIAEISTKSPLRVEGHPGSTPLNVIIYGVKTDDVLRVTTVSATQRSAHQAMSSIKDAIPGVSQAVDPKTGQPIPQEKGMIDQLKDTVSSYKDKAEKSLVGKLLGFFAGDSSEEASQMSGLAKQGFGGISKMMLALGRSQGAIKHDKDSPMMSKITNFLVSKAFGMGAYGVGKLAGGENEISLADALWRDGTEGDKEKAKIAAQKEADAKTDAERIERDSKPGILAKAKDFVDSTQTPENDSVNLTRKQKKALRKSIRDQNKLKKKQEQEASVNVSADSSPDLNINTKAEIEAQAKQDAVTDASIKSAEALESINNNTSIFGKLFGWVSNTNNSPLLKLGKKIISGLGNFFGDAFAIADTAFEGVAGHSMGVVAGGVATKVGGAAVGLVAKLLPPVVIAAGVYKILQSIVDGFTGEGAGFSKAFSNILIGDTSEDSLGGRLKNAISGFFKGGAIGAAAGGIPTGGIGMLPGMFIGGTVGAVSHFFGSEVNSIASTIGKAFGGSDGSGGLSGFISDIGTILSGVWDNTVRTATSTAAQTYDAAGGGIGGAALSVAGLLVGGLTGLFGGNTNSAMQRMDSMANTLTPGIEWLMGLYSRVKTYAYNVINGPSDHSFYFAEKAGGSGITGVFGSIFGAMVGLPAALMGYTPSETYTAMGLTFDKDTNFTEMALNIGSSLMGITFSVLDALASPFRWMINKAFRFEEALSTRGFYAGLSELFTGSADLDGIEFKNKINQDPLEDIAVSVSTWLGKGLYNIVLALESPWETLKNGVSAIPSMIRDTFGWLIDLEDIINKHGQMAGYKYLIFGTKPTSLVDEERNLENYSNKNLLQSHIRRARAAGAPKDLQEEMLKSGSSKAASQIFINWKNGKAERGGGASWSDEGGTGGDPSSDIPISSTENKLLSKFPSKITNNNLTKPRSIGSIFRDTFHSGMNVARQWWNGTPKESSAKRSDSSAITYDSILSGGVAGSTTSVSTEGVAFPTTDPRITSPFGPRKVDGGSSYHKAIDIAGAFGSPAFSMMGGRVTAAGGRYGEVRIEHTGTPFATRYLHLNSVGVKAGDVVSPGQAIGTVGGRGPKGPRQYAPHLHLELLEKFADKKWYQVDPLGFLQEYSGQNIKYNKDVTPSRIAYGAQFRHRTGIALPASTETFGDAEFYTDPKKSNASPELTKLSSPDDFKKYMGESSGSGSASHVKPNVTGTAEFSEGSKQAEYTKNTAVALKASQDSEAAAAASGFNSEGNKIFMTMAEILGKIMEYSKQTAEKELEVKVSSIGGTEGSTQPDAKTIHEINKATAGSKTKEPLVFEGDDGIPHTVFIQSQGI